MTLHYKIKKFIQDNKGLTIQDLMTAIASDSEYGYYSSKYELSTNKDFITSPEISQLFGEMIAIWSVNSWYQLYKPEEIILAELGPGRGTMMRDILLATKKILDFQAAISVHLIETSQSLQNIQKSTLNNFISAQNVKLFWHNSLSDIPKKPLILVCNEFFDALPIQQYIKLENKWHEVLVNHNSLTDELYFAYETVDNRTNNFLNLDYPHTKEGDIVEISTQSIEIIKKIAEHIKEFTGTALIIDYGYYRDNQLVNQNYSSTLQAVYNHKYHPVLENLGEADVTSHVDFFNLKQAALVKGVKVIGPITQREFLQTMGIQLRARHLLSKLTSSHAEELILGMERLISNQQMGNLFKVLIINN